MLTHELLVRAKNAIHAGDKSLRSAAEDIANAQAQGATQRDIARAVGKSAAWVNRLLQWKDKGFPDSTPFGPASKAARQRRLVQATEQTKGGTDAERGAAHIRDDERATAKSIADDKERKRLSDSNTPARKGRVFDSNARDRLIRALDMLRADRPGERASAARQVETLRSELGLTWQQLIISAISDSAALAA